MLNTLEYQAKQRAIIEQLEIEQAIEANLCLKSLKYFVKKHWHIIEPGTVFVDGWHIDVVCAHLEAAARFELVELIITMPPRHMKSILASVMFPAWVWAHKEWACRRFMNASYSTSLSVRDGVKMRSIIESQLYQELFKPEWVLRDDQNQKLRFENTETGFRYCTSVGGSTVGEGADFLTLDDPIKPTNAQSVTIRESTNEWVDTSWSTRANDPKKHCRISIMQRLHAEDPVGHALSKKRADKEKRALLVLQARFQKNSKVKTESPIPFTDPRKEDGELLWPERFDEASIKQLEDDLGEESHAQLQQDPRPKSGGLFNKDWWQLYLAPPSPILETVQFIDAAQKPGVTSDYTVIATWIRTQNGFYIWDLWREKVDMPTLESIVVAKYGTFRPNAVVIEDAAGGASLIQYLLRSTTIPVLKFSPHGRDKVIRASAAAPTVKSGKVFLPKTASWTQDFITEHERFPKSTNDDQVDTTSMAVEYFLRKAASEPRVRSV